jgi:hypothetical protein
LLADKAETPATEWLAVRLADAAPEEPRPVEPAQTPGAIEVEWPRGRVRVEGAAEAATLRLVLEWLGA